MTIMVFIMASADDPAIIKRNVRVIKQTASSLGGAGGDPIIRPRAIIYIVLARDLLAGTIN